MRQPTHAVQAAIPFKRDTPPGDSSLAAPGAGILIVSLIAVGAVLVVRKRLRIGRPAARRPAMLRVLETQRLGPRALVSVIEFKGTLYLVAQGEHGISCIATAPVGERE
jgi:flagellar biogenesis protein FliO